MNRIAPAAALALVLTAAPAALSAQGRASPARVEADVRTMVGFGTRHTLSSTTDRKRGIGAARDWAAGEFAGIGAACGGCLVVERVAERMEGARIPGGAVIENVLGIQRGTGGTNEVVIIAGHIDSRVRDVMDATADAPGANDNASGTALVIEAARLLSRRQHRATIVYAVLSGEEQSLLGGRLLAKTAQERGWTVLAMQNNDIVGGTKRTDGVRVTNRVRVFSEGIRASEDLDAQKRRRGNGGEMDGPSRALAKAAREVARANRALGLEVLTVGRPDRFQRGGDHLPSLDVGLAAVRFSAAVEDYDHQHEDVRVENGRAYGDTPDEMDFRYLARVTDLNVALATRLAAAPMAPASVAISGALSQDTTVRWPAVPGATGYKVRWRRSDAPDWTDARVVPAGTTETVLRGVVVDDHFVGVSSIGTDGGESIVRFGEASPRS